MAGLNPRTAYTPEDVIRQSLDPGGQRDFQADDVQSLIQELLDARGNQYAPQGPSDNYQGNEWRDEPYQVAGDVVPLRTHPVQTSDIKMRLNTPGVYRGTQGVQSIEAAGGRQSPYLDLMDVLMGRFGK